jgi:enamine deaminase RidA (YjgF/YER057c/UK114 family)
METDMIERHGNTTGIPGLPAISQVVTHDGLVYLCGVTPDPSGDITTQTRQVLERVDTLLRRAGTDKSRLLTAQVWLSDMALFDEHNVAWNEWVDQHNPPARACVQSRLWRDGMLVEVTAMAVGGQ